MHGLFQHLSDCFRGDGFESKELAPAQQWRNQVEAGVVSGGSDEADIASFHIG